MISVVIPTWNEEAWLPRLLGQLDHLDGICEVIVADNSSTDATRSIAERNGCSVVPGGRPARGRNLGAAAATGNTLLFIDADAVLTFSVARFIAGYSPPVHHAAVHFRQVPIAAPRPVRAAYRLMDRYFAALHRVRIEQGLGTAILVDKDLYWRVGGSDEALKFGEDADLLRRLGRGGTVKYRRDTFVYVSARRFITENRYLFSAKTALWAALRLSNYRGGGPAYRWLPHDPRLADIEGAWLSEASEVLPGWTP